jgi:hypothetical protein
MLQVDLRVSGRQRAEVFTSTGHTLSTRLHMLQDGDQVPRPWRHQRVCWAGLADLNMG